jgi:hypothetical protein
MFELLIYCFIALGIKEGLKPGEGTFRETDGIFDYLFKE